MNDSARRSEEKSSGMEESLKNLLLEDYTSVSFCFFFIDFSHSLWLSPSSLSLFLSSALIMHSSWPSTLIFVFHATLAK